MALPTLANAASTAAGAASAAGGSTPNARRYAARSTESSLMRCSTRARGMFISCAVSKGCTAWLHSVSARPSHVNQRWCAALSTVIECRVPVPSPLASARPSANPCAGSWHVAQLTVPLTERRSSKKRRWPSAAASALSAQRFVGSAGNAPSGGLRRTRRAMSSGSHPPPAGPTVARASVTVKFGVGVAVAGGTDAGVGARAGVTPDGAACDGASWSASQTITLATAIIRASPPLGRVP